MRRKGRDEELDKRLGRGRGSEVFRTKTGWGRRGIASGRVGGFLNFSHVSALHSGLHAGDELMNAAEFLPPEDGKTVRTDE